MQMDVWEHDDGDEKCGICWNGYPKKCDCGGLVHAEFGDEDSDCNYYLTYKCDKCGKTDEVSE